MGARWYDSAIGRWLQPDTIVPDYANPQALNRYSYGLGNPVKYRDPSGHWVETVLDAAFIAYDVHQIQQEGWTPVNTLALAADMACAILPIATGGGPGVRLAFAGGELALEGAARVPAAIRVGQGAEKLIQAVENGEQPGARSQTASGLPTLRAEYEAKVRGLTDRASEMRNAGRSTEEIARSLHAERRALGIEYKGMTPPAQLEQIYARNLEKYGDPLGPSIEWLLEHGKTWEDIIDSACRPGGKDIVPKLLDSAGR